VLRNAKQNAFLSFPKETLFFAANQPFCSKSEANCLPNASSFWISSGSAK
jgi:hypothetical protein